MRRIAHNAGYDHDGGYRDVVGWRFTLMAARRSKAGGGGDSTRCSARPVAADLSNPPSARPRRLSLVLLANVFDGGDVESVVRPVRRLVAGLPIPGSLDGRGGGFARGAAWRY